MIRHRIEEKPAFSVIGVKTRINGQNNEEFAAFWNTCSADGTDIYAEFWLPVRRKIRFAALS